MSDEVLDVVRGHLAAFNAGDVDALVAGFAEDATFADGGQLLVGRRQIAKVFADAFAMPAEVVLELRQAVVDGDTAGCELLERVTVGGDTTDLDVAAFYTVRGGLLVRVRVYREE